MILILVTEGDVKSILTKHLVQPTIFITECFTFLLFILEDICCLFTLSLYYQDFIQSSITIIRITTKSVARDPDTRDCGRGEEYPNETLSVALLINGRKSLFNRIGKSN